MFPHLSGPGRSSDGFATLQLGMSAGALKRPIVLYSHFPDPSAGQKLLQPVFCHIVVGPF